MRANTKTYLLIVLLVTVTFVAKAQDMPKIDESNLITQMMGLANLSQVQADSYLTSKKYTVTSNSIKKLKTYDANFIKYKMVGSTDSYSIVLVKDRIINVLFITYSINTYQTALDDALKIGFKKSESGNTGSNQIIYVMGNERFIVQIINANDKTFYVMSISDLDVTNKAIADSKSQ